MVRSNVTQFPKATGSTKANKPRPIGPNTLSVRVPQMCEMLSIGPTKAAELIKTGKVESVLLGKTRLIKVDSIRALLDGRAA